MCRALKKRSHGCGERWVNCAIDYHERNSAVTLAILLSTNLLISMGQAPTLSVSAYALVPGTLIR
jgi:hypothetical protein